MTLAALLAMGLAACGSTQSDRTLSGAGLGAGGGAIIAAATGGSVGTGAVVGAVVGGVVGATTSSDDIDLGDPVWRRHHHCRHHRYRDAHGHCVRHHD